ncbi:MAG: ABC transporter permease subunit [Verrucomicrobiaceae bacterium]|nr:MAG: ABC transporter permease subunit [Verrucomicrobiaceae bacterium]
MHAYFIRRLLLIIPTLLGVSMLLYAMIQFVPGGPVEQMRMAAAQQEGGRGVSSGSANSSLSEDQIDAYKELFGFDKPAWAGYLCWLGVLPRDTNIKRVEFLDGAKELRTRLPKTRQPIRIVREGESVSFNAVDGSEIKGWEIAFERKTRKTKDDQGREGTVEKVYAKLYQKKFDGVLQGSLGQSIFYSDSVTSIIASRLPATAWFGFWSFLLTYLISIPLGVVKALKHRSAFDTVTSGGIFVGYAVPAYALGALLVVFLSARLGWFPMGGLTSIQFRDFTFMEKVRDLISHSVLPLLCYVIGDFAFLTMMMKNQLLETLSADYVRTAVAKGVPFRRAVFGHAFRNAFVPIATNLGQFISLFVGGSFLLERIFDINGVALLGFEALLQRDYPLVIGVAMLGALLLVIGNIISDFITALVDPRISYR